MALYKRAGSPFWQFEFQHDGKPIRRSTGTTSEKQARAIERKAKAELKEQAIIARVLGAPVTASITITEAALKYWGEVEDKHASGTDTYRDLMRLVNHFGKDTPLAEIDDDAVRGLVKWRRQHRVMPHNAPKDRKPEDYPFVSPATVNHTVIRLQALFKRAKKWKGENRQRLKFPDEPDWPEHKLPVAKKPARILRANESKKLDAATRDDYADFQEFAHESGRRFSYCYGLKWSEVDWDKLLINKTGKIKPDGTPKEEPLPITPKILAILKRQRGNHPVYVFTYVARVHREARRKGQTYINKATGNPFVAQWDQRPIVKGKRYHLLRNAAKTAFRRAVAAAGIEDFGFHGIRRTRATEVRNATGDTRMVQKLLGHTSIATTERYLGDDLADVRAAMEKADKRKGSLTRVPHKKRRRVA